MERAKLRPLEDHRLNALLRERLHSWQEADAIPRLLRRSRGPARPDAIAADPEAAEWLALARTYVGHAQQLPRMPAVREITPEALKPYLGGLSPYGPRGRQAACR